MDEDIGTEYSFSCFGMGVRPDLSVRRGIQFEGVSERGM
jgi:hypothetical protein